jgi:Protein of unknown function (DUF2946)
MILNAAWPLLADAKPADPASLLEICSASGATHAPGGTSNAPDKRLRCPHCSHCGFGAERGATISHAGSLPLPLLPAPAPTVLARSDAPRPGIALYPVARPRAPPSPS